MLYFLIALSSYSAFQCCKNVLIIVVRFTCKAAVKQRLFIVVVVDSVIAKPPTYVATVAIDLWFFLHHPVS